VALVEAPILRRTITLARVRDSLRISRVLRRTARERITIAVLRDSQLRRGISREHQRIIVREQTTIATFRDSQPLRRIVREPITTAPEHRITVRRNRRIIVREPTIEMFPGRERRQTTVRKRRIIVRQHRKTIARGQIIIATRGSLIIGLLLR
jgi:hypothetical protein